VGGRRGDEEALGTSGDSLAEVSLKVFVIFCDDFSLTMRYSFSPLSAVVEIERFDQEVGLE
jgi:hypothetical protein